MSVKDAAKFLHFLVKAFEANVVEKNETADGIVEHAKVGIDDSILECSEAHGEWGPRMATMHLYVPGTDGRVGKPLVRREMQGERGQGRSREASISARKVNLVCSEFLFLQPKAKIRRVEK